MLRRTLAMLFGAVLLASALPRPANAVLLWIDDVVVGNSWKQRFLLQDVGPFDYLRVDLIRIQGQAELQGPAFRNFSGGPPGWQNTQTTPIVATAAGPLTTHLEWDLWFTKQPTDLVTFLFTAYDASGGGRGVWRDGALLHYDGRGPHRGWAVVPIHHNDWDPGTVVPIPEPSSLLLMGGGLALASIVGSKRKRRAR